MYLCDTSPLLRITNLTYTIFCTGVESCPAVPTSSSSSSTAASSRLPSRIYKDGEEYPEEEVYVEPEKKVKTVMEVAPSAAETALDEGELAAAQEEVMSVNVNGCLLDEEESRKRYAMYHSLLSHSSSEFFSSVSNYPVPPGLRFGSKIFDLSWMSALADGKSGMKES
jgi:hypothetical protein